MQEEDLERAKKFGSKKVCLGSSFAEHNRIKRNLYHFKSLFLSKRRNEKNRNIPTRTIDLLLRRIPPSENYEEKNKKDRTTIIRRQGNIVFAGIRVGRRRTVETQRQGPRATKSGGEGSGTSNQPRHIKMIGVERWNSVNAAQ
ncbi:hypothetical protein Leryth_027203 [Lithospermum erythrorhizon]|nr:hypothetical protein Leryth_027203 [Lithospermum erythrorhizon]